MLAAAEDFVPVLFTDSTKNRVEPACGRQVPYLTSAAPDLCVVKRTCNSACCSQNEAG